MCVHSDEAQLDSFTYMVCPFDRVEQKSTDGKSRLLGRWVGWGDSAGAAATRRPGHTQMHFTGGRPCGGSGSGSGEVPGQKQASRNATVQLVCGRESKVVAVTEPSPCSYRVQFRSPCVCRATDVPLLYAAEFEGRDSSVAPATKPPPIANTGYTTMGDTSLPPPPPVHSDL
jgi:hypothetical protein